MHQMFRKYEVERKFDEECFGGSKHPIFLKLYTRRSGKIHVHMWDGKG
jgi:hypothetical protein